MNNAIYVKSSHNQKITNSNNVDATYVSTYSCPDSCQIKNECYAKLGYCGYVSNRLNKEKTTSFSCAQQEAKLIRSILKPNKYLRLHVVGDSRTIKGSKLINSSIKEWKKNGGEICWGYTHCWKTIPKLIWNNVSMIASIDSIKEVELARKQGYTSALIVDQFQKNSMYYLPNSTVKWIPCLAQTKNKTCEECKLCFKADKLYQYNIGILFLAHGAKKKLLKKHLGD